MSQPTIDYVQNLPHAIEQKRREMLEASMIQGMGSEETLEISQELDALILQYEMALISQ